MGMGVVVGPRPSFGLWGGFVFCVWVVFLFALGWVARFLSHAGMLWVCWLGWDEDGQIHTLQVDSLGVVGIV